MSAHRILVGDCRTILKTIRDNTVHCVVTSPPYWGLRDYKVEGQIGLEFAHQTYISNLIDTFREVRRVLRDDGTLWLNLGDSYAGSGRGGNPTPSTSTLQGGQCSQEASMVRRTRKPTEIGGTARDNAVTNVGRRATRGSQLPAGFHEQARLDGSIGRAWVPPPPGFKQKDLMGMPWRVAFALQADGWYLRQDIIWAKPNPMPESVRDRCTKSHEYLFLLTKSEQYYFDAEAIKEPAVTAGKTVKMADGWDTGSGGHGTIHRSGREKGKNNGAVQREKRNRRSVWNIGTEAFAEAHFATFPTRLVEPCILAGCPEGGVVLDPFGGAGTTALVAKRLNRHAVLIELNPDYVAMAERRIARELLSGIPVVPQPETAPCASPSPGFRLF